MINSVRNAARYVGDKLVSAIDTVFEALDRIVGIDDLTGGDPVPETRGTCAPVAYEKSSFTPRIQHRLMNVDTGDLEIAYEGSAKFEDALDMGYHVIPESLHNEFAVAWRKGIRYINIRDHRSALGRYRCEVLRRDHQNGYAL